MRQDNGRAPLGSYAGFFCTAFLGLLLLSYTYQKIDVLKNKKDVDILSTVTHAHFDPDYIFDFQKGFNIAAGFTAYDSNPEPIDDPRYGELVFNHYYWGKQPDGTYGAGRRPFEYRNCTDEELGFKEGKAKFFPIYSESYETVDFYHRKLKCGN